MCVSKFTISNSRRNASERGRLFGQPLSCVTDAINQVASHNGMWLPQRVQQSHTNQAERKSGPVLPGAKMAALDNKIRQGAGVVHRLDRASTGL